MVCTASCSFNSQPPEGGWIKVYPARYYESGFNSQPPEGGWVMDGVFTIVVAQFQLTAARRRLGLKAGSDNPVNRFNSQPPEGGWNVPICPISNIASFQLTAARRRLE